MPKNNYFYYTYKHEDFLYYLLSFAMEQYQDEDPFLSDCAKELIRYILGMNETESVVVTKIDKGTVTFAIVNHDKFILIAGGDPFDLDLEENVKDWYFVHYDPFANFVMRQSEELHGMYLSMNKLREICGKYPSRNMMFQQYIHFLDEQAVRIKATLQKPIKQWDEDDDYRRFSLHLVEDSVIDMTRDVACVPARYPIHSHMLFWYYVTDDKLESMGVRGLVRSIYLYTRLNTINIRYVSEDNDNPYDPYVQKLKNFVREIHTMPIFFDLNNYKEAIQLAQSIMDHLTEEFRLESKDIHRAFTKSRIPMKMMERAELHLHTKLSDDISVIDPKEVLEYAIAHSHKAIAFTNLNNVQDFPAIADAYKQCGDSTLKVIYGAELRYMGEDGKAPYGITIIAKNQFGIKELYTIISSINSDGVYDLVNIDVVRQNHKNLLIGSCGNVGELYEAVTCGRNPEKAAKFYDYFEIYPTEDEKERAIYKKIYELGSKLGIPVAATGNCHYLDKEDEICRRVIRVVNGHKHDQKNLFYHTTDEMLAEFSYLGEDAAYKLVVTNTNKITDLITQATPLKEGIYPPVIENAYEQVQELVYTKAKMIYGNSLPVPVAERLETELKYIQKYEYAVYYCIAYRMVRHMNDSGYYVTPRGSAGSVLVAFLLGVSDTNPLPAHYYCPQCHYIDFEVAEPDGFDLPDQVCPVCGCPLRSDGHNIPFETFMGYDGSKMPYIDLDVPKSMKYSEFAFIQELFGADKVANAGNIVTLWDQDAEGYISVYEVKTDDYFTKKQRSYICEKLRGIKQRDKIVHYKIIVLPQGMEFEDFTPIRETKSPSPIKKATHFNYYSLDDTVIKLNVIGHFALDMLKLLEDFTGISIQNVVWNDSEVYALFERADTLCIPEFDKHFKHFMKDMLLRLKPKSFDDLVQISGLSHGTGIWLDNGENLLKENHTLSELPALRDDILLRLMRYGLERDSAYQIAEYVWKGKFYYDSNLTFELVERMRNKNVPEWYIQSLRKIRHLFPKAHVVAYVMNAVRMAWYKIHYPTEFYAAYLSCYYPGGPMDKVDDPHFLKVANECSRRGIQLLMPDAEKSHCVNYLPEQGNIRIPYVK